MVGVAQLVEHGIVTPVVVGSIPIVHPIFRKAPDLTVWRLFCFTVSDFGGCRFRVAGQGASSYQCCSMMLRCLPVLLARSAVREMIQPPLYIEEVGAEPWLELAVFANRARRNRLSPPSNGLLFFYPFSVG